MDIGDSASGLTDLGGSSLFFRRETRGCVPTTDGSHFSVSLVRSILGVQERRIHRQVKSQEDQSGFCHGPGTVEKLNIHGRVLVRALEFAQAVYLSFVNLEKVFDHVPWGVLYGVLLGYGVPNSQIQAISSPYH